jgi:hypothetical protein
MNAVEIEVAISELSSQPFDREQFPYEFLAAFGNKETTIKRLMKGDTNASDVPNGVLQRNNIHIAVCDLGQVGNTLKVLRESPKTTAAKAKFILATDGEWLEAEELISGEHFASRFVDLELHFGFFLPLAGISTIKEIKENPIDVRATSRLNRLYVELLKDNPEWASEARRHDMNHFMARLIFCFFAEDTGIFRGTGLFTLTVDRMAERDSSNTHEVVSELFRSMNVHESKRKAEKVPSWADAFPYVNGGLFSGSTEVPKFSKIARSYLIRAGELDWKKINPDIFGSMIQAVADDEERGALGMHYTSVPNILKVLNPLFLDDLNAQLEAAGDNHRMLLNLRKRIAKIRVFDPACGSGNFLVIAYKQLRAIESKINQKRQETHLRSEIPLTNFRGIELRDFPAEIARLALIIAEYQCDELYLGQQEALAEFLPLSAENWITCGNALRIDWRSICPPTGNSVKLVANDLFETPLEQTEIDFDNEGGETYICGNPPYKGSTWQDAGQKADLESVFKGRTTSWKSLDYVAGWFLKAADYGKNTSAVAAFVSTNSICQGQQVPILWPLILSTGHEICFAHTSFKWANLASHNAGVTVVIVGLSSKPIKQKILFEVDLYGNVVAREANYINAYLLSSSNVIVEGAKSPISLDAQITDGSGALDGGNLILDRIDMEKISAEDNGKFSSLIKPYIGSSEFIRGNLRWCLWIEDKNLELALKAPEIDRRVIAVKEFRENAGTRAKTAVGRPHKFAWINKKNGNQIIIPTVFSERREYITAGYLSDEYVINNAASIVQYAELHIFSIISSKLHMSWVNAVGGKLKTDLRYTSSTCFNTFPAPTLTDQNKVDLTRSAENILLAREVHFPATIADLYDPETMPENLRRAHEQNDELLERIYIGRRFKNDTERLEKLFELYTKMTAKPNAAASRKTKGQ